jgi:hypothetical protein
MTVDALEGDPREVTQLVTRLAETIVRAVRMQHALSGDAADDVSAAVTRVLTELGLGEER